MSERRGVTPALAWLLTGGLMAATVAVIASRLGSTPLLEIDSAGYIEASGIRGLGYPAFLYLARLAGIPLEGLPWLQLALHVATLPVLFRALARCTGGVWLPALVTAACYLNPEVARYHAQVLSESLFLSVLVLFVAALLSWLAGEAPRRLASVSLLAALMVTIKPVAWAFVALLALLVVARLWRGGERAKVLCAFLLPLLAVVLAEHAASRVIHGPERTSLAGRHLFAKAGMVDAAVPDPLLRDGPNATLHRAMANDAEAIRRLVERAPDARIARFLTTSYEIFLQTLFAANERGAIGAERNLDDALIDTALARLRHNWPGYLALTATHYVSLWMLYDASHPAHYERLNAFIAAERPLPFEAAMPALVETVQPAGVKAVVARPAIAASGGLTVLLAVAGLVALLRPASIPTPWRQAGLLALGLHGYCLLVALTGVALPRYLLGVWPVLVCALGLAASGLLGWAIRHRRAPSTPEG